MGLPNGIRSLSIPADIVVRDREGNVVLLVEIKAPKTSERPVQPDSRLLKWASLHQDQPRPYLMIANTTGIFVFSTSARIPGPHDVRPGASQILAVDLTLDTRDVLT